VVLVAGAMEWARHTTTHVHDIISFVYKEQGATVHVPPPTALARLGKCEGAPTAFTTAPPALHGTAAAGAEQDKGQ